jgi:hypothetical protein
LLDPVIVDSQVACDLVRWWHARLACTESQTTSATPEASDVGEQVVQGTDRTRSPRAARSHGTIGACVGQAPRRIDDDAVLAHLDSEVCGELGDARRCRGLSLSGQFKFETLRWG